MIQAKNLTKRYGSLCAVDNISFTAAKGEILGLPGPNGASDSRRRKYEEVARRRLVRELRRLERGLDRSSIFGDEANRRHATSRIRAVENSWSESQFADFAPPGIPRT